MIRGEFGESDGTREERQSGRVGDGRKNEVAGRGHGGAVAVAHAVFRFVKAGERREETGQKQGR